MNIQQELTPSLTAMVGYVGSRGVHMPYRTEDLDMVLPTLTSAGYLGRADQMEKAMLASRASYQLARRPSP
jgi:hypothetical protein